MESAQEIRDMMQKVASEPDLRKIMEQIKSAASVGRYSTYTYTKMSDGVYNALREQGFRVERDWDSREQGILNHISWDKE